MLQFVCKNQIMQTKKLFISWALVLAALGLLSGCGGGDTVSTGSLKTYEGNEFTIEVNPDWKVITPTEFYADVPKETVVAFTAPEAFDGFFINVSVVREDLKQAVSATDYARANINLAGQTLTDYQKIQESGNVHIFQARLNPTEKLIRFVQLYATKGNFGYIVTGGMLPDTDQGLRDQVGAMVTSFKLKAI